MTFEEQFPSWNKFMADINLKKQKTKSELEYYKLRCEYQLQAMEKHCLDKQKVKEAFNNTPLFADRKKIVGEFEKWAKKNKVEICLFSLVTWYDGKLRGYMKKELGINIK